MVTTDRVRHRRRPAAPGRARTRLAPGRRSRSTAAQPGTADVVVVADDVDFGIVSDIDDTVIATWLPRLLLATYNTFVLAEEARKPVDGMAGLYAGLLASRPTAPTIYVSTGPWNAALALTRFLAHHDFPRGPLLLTDWGPTNTGWFRSGREHKMACLRGLATDFPAISWVLVGDDGQRDPVIYAEFAREHPERVRAIALRELSMGEQVLAHGTPTEMREDPTWHGRPEVRGADGHELAERLRDRGEASADLGPDLLVAGLAERRHGDDAVGALRLAEEGVAWSTPTRRPRSTRRRPSASAGPGPCGVPGRARRTRPRRRGPGCRWCPCPGTPRCRRRSH